ncbi:hypothetical protein RND71_027487 [Anisodus tanguticus]|uniref:Uncharacterized protein n=1 Tax=Anisodus tanguticus TaxID=243964 RepID=A0AAE1V849_9SOLA|nr:hypothetical protein RND71_027487 [Anisodus tanguticus]
MGKKSFYNSKYPLILVSKYFTSIRGLKQRVSRMKDDVDQYGFTAYGLFSKEEINEKG